STTDDMIMFLAANLPPVRGALEQAMAFAHEQRAPAGSPNMRIGLNWFTLHVGSDSIVWHNGGTGGYRTFIGFEPARRVAVVVMTNSGGEGADDIGMHLLDLAMPLAPKPAPPVKHTAIDLPADSMARYVGVYRLAPNFDLTVTLTGDTLWLQATGQGRNRLWAESPTEFFFKAVDAQITFLHDAKGAVSGLILHQNGQHPIANKIK
ncbi:MAG: DUF3471 domain-containing protein, partial [Gemmatimonadaceae bacterium]